jgi:hypothetical protein
MFQHYIPGYVRLVALALGLLDLGRGVVHTILIDHGAREIAGLNIDGPDGRDLLQLMAIFGISNLISGAALIMAAAWDRRMAWLLTGIIPVAYVIGVLALRAAQQGLSESTANWGGIPMLQTYLAVCLVTFVSGGIIAFRRSRI